MVVGIIPSLINDCIEPTGVCNVSSLSFAASVTAVLASSSTLAVFNMCSLAA